MTGSLAVIGVAGVMRKLIDDRLAELGLSVRHLSVLGHVRARPGISMAALARRLSITTQSIHTTVHQMIDNGYLYDDSLTRGKASTLQITDSGRAVLTKALTIVHGVDDEVGMDAATTSRLMEAAHRAVDLRRRSESP